MKHLRKRKQLKQGSHQLCNRNTATHEHTGQDGNYSVPLKEKKETQMNILGMTCFLSIYIFMCIYIYITVYF